MFSTLAPAAALGGHLLHVVVYGGALLLGLLVFVGVKISESRRAGELRLAIAGSAPRIAGASRRTTGVRPTWNSPAEAGDPGHATDQASPEVARAIQIAFIGLCIAAGTHLSVIHAHFEQSWMYGAFFVLASSCQVALAFLVLARPTRAVLLTALSFSAAIVVLWGYSRFVGVPVGPDNGATEQLGVLDVMATIAEAATAIAVLTVLKCGSWASSWRWSIWSTINRVVLVIAAVGVPLIAAFAPHS